MMDRVILGKNCIVSSDSRKTQLNNNIIVCGTSGCGKTMSISEPRLLETRNSSLIITLSKRKLVSKYRSLFRQRGYNVWVLDFAKPGNSNVSYDPLKYVKSNMDITFLAESIVKSNSQESSSSADPYWDNAAKSLLSAEIAYILEMVKNASLSNVLGFHDKLDIEENIGLIKTTLDYKFECLSLMEPNSFAVSCWKSFTKLPVKTGSCVLGTLNTALYTIFTPELREMMQKENKIDFQKLASEKTILFVVTSAVNPALNCFVNMFYSQVFKELFEFAEKREDGVLPVPVHVLCDDFAVGSRIHNFPEYISIFREKGISVSLLLQSESQLESMYGANAATTIINNADTYVYMGGMDLKTCRSISEKMNAPLEEILQMPLGQEIIFRRGQKPIVTQRYNVLENELYQEITKRYEEEVSSRGR